MKLRKDWSITDRRLRLGSHLFVSFQRSVLLTGPSADPPRSHGAAPLWETDDATRGALDADVLVPVGGHEALWIGFEPADDRVAVATRVGVEFVVGGAMIDAITGAHWTDVASSSPQNYVVSPPQWSLYGTSDGRGRARQFARATGDERVDSTDIARLHLICIPPRVTPLLRPSPAPPPALHGGGPGPGQRRDNTAGGTGHGLVPQPIHADPFGLQHWSVEAAVTVRVLFASPEEFERRSGIPGPKPLDPADTYQGKRLP